MYITNIKNTGSDVTRRGRLLGVKVYLRFKKVGVTFLHGSFCIIVFIESKVNVSSIQFFVPEQNNPSQTVTVHCSSAG